MFTIEIGDNLAFVLLAAVFAATIVKGILR